MPVKKVTRDGAVDESSADQEICKFNVTVHT